MVVRQQHGIEHRLLPAPEPDCPRGNTVDAGIKIIQCHVHSVHCMIADNLLRHLLCLVIKQDDMVRVPSDRTGDVQGNFREEAQQRRDFIGNNLCGMIMSVIHQRHAFVAVKCRVAERKFRGTGGVGLHPDAKDLGLHGRFYLAEIVGLRKDLVNRILIAHSGSHAVCRNILQPVSRPDIHNCGYAGLLRKITGDTDAAFSVLNPELPHRLIRAGQVHAVRSDNRIREKCRVEINPHFMLFRKIHPFLEMLRLQLVSGYGFPVLKNRIAGMEVQLYLSGNQGHHLFDILHQLFRCFCPSRIVSGCLDAPRKRTVLIETGHIVSLPAVQRNRDIFERLNGLVGIYTVFRVLFLCNFILLFYSHELFLLFHLSAAFAALT